MGRAVLSLAIALIASACLTPEPSPPQTAPEGTGSTGLDQLSADLDLDLVDVSVLRVLDGDSIVASIGGRETDVRLEGINTPERDECLGDAARDNLEALLDGTRVQMSGSEFDQFDRLLGVVVADGIPVNVAQVLSGLALPLAIESPLEDLILAAEAQARSDKVGLWDIEACGSGPLPEIRITGISANPPGRDEDDLDLEYTTIENAGDTAIDLSGWTLRDESTANRFNFSATQKLAPGASLRVVVGCTTGPDQVAWCSDRPIWNNGGDTAILLDSDGRIVDLFRYRDSG